VRPVRPLAVAVAFAMALLAGTEQVAMALGQQTRDFLDERSRSALGFE